MCIDHNTTCKHCGKGYHLCIIFHDYDKEFCTKDCWIAYNKERGIEVDQECGCWICERAKGEWILEGTKLIWKEKA